MPVSVTMPQLGESVTEGTVTRWLKAEGDTVQADEPLLEVSTDKVDTEIPSPASGVLTRIIAAEDAVVLVGGELAVIGESADAGEAPAAEAPLHRRPRSPPWSRRLRLLQLAAACCGTRARGRRCGSCRSCRRPRQRRPPRSRSRRLARASPRAR